MGDELDRLVHNNVRRRIEAGEVAVSMIVRLVQSVEVASIAKACGFDSLYIDLEHSSFSLSMTSQICMASLNAGVAPFVRVPSHEPEYVSRVLDGGALGIIAPHVRDAKDAARIVKHAKFPPFGGRSVSIGLPQLKFRNWPLAEARDVMNRETTVVAMIETPDAVARASEIAAVEGVDILMIGTNDLCAEMGIDGQFEHQKIADAYASVIEACRRHGKTAGIGGLASKPKLIAKFVAQGARYVSSGADLSFILSAGKARADEIRAMATTS
jgi:2-keto-3-deoxy-L-rhamnonate aldolase RhmA